MNKDKKQTNKKAVTQKTTRSMRPKSSPYWSQIPTLALDSMAASLLLIWYDYVSSFDGPPADNNYKFGTNQQKQQTPNTWIYGGATKSS